MRRSTHRRRGHGIRMPQNRPVANHKSSDKYRSRRTCRRSMPSFKRRSERSTRIRCGNTTNSSARSGRRNRPVTAMSRSGHRSMSLEHLRRNSSRTQRSNATFKERCPTSRRVASNVTRTQRPPMRSSPTSPTYYSVLNEPRCNLPTIVLLFRLIQKQRKSL